MRKAIVTGTIMFGVFLVGSAGCASNPAGDNAQAGNEEGEKVVCRRVAPVGSHRKRTVCKTVRDIDEEREGAQRTIRNRQRGTVTNDGGN